MKRDQLRWRLARLNRARMRPSEMLVTLTLDGDNLNRLIHALDPNGDAWRLANMVDRVEVTTMRRRAP